MTFVDGELQPGYRLGFENCSEIAEPVSLTVTGPMPTWLEDTLYHNGPGVFDILRPELGLRGSVIRRPLTI